jgi:acyl dehydratase
MPQLFTVVAQNLPEHARNAIHTDAGAQAAGFPRALVAGVTTYAYLTHPVAAAWGVDWLTCGGGEVRFRRPVFAGDTVHCRPSVVTDVSPDEAVLIEACTDSGDDPRATFRAARHSSPTPMRAGEKLPSRQLRLEGELGSDYGERAGEHLALYDDQELVHPAVWPAIANLVVHRDVARGPWIHTRSIVRHHSLAHAGEVADVQAVVVRRFERHGETAVLDVHIHVGDRLVASLEHEAIVALP